MLVNKTKISTKSVKMSSTATHPSGIVLFINKLQQVTAV
jgi:hypothetical protein